MNQESKLREEICRIGASLYQRGYTVARPATSARGSTTAG